MTQAKWRNWRLTDIRRDLTTRGHPVSKPVISRSVLRMGTFTGYTYRRAQQANSMSDFDTQADAADLLPNYFGAQWAAISEELNKMYTFRQAFVSARRADLSHDTP